jgi:hypothetical protein
MRLQSVLLTLTFALSLASPAAGEVVRDHFPLPSNGMPLDLASLVAEGEEPVRIVLSGTLSSSIDGSEIDALGRSLGDRRIEAEGPFVRLPAGSRLVASDPEIHRYTFEIPRRSPMPLALHLAPLAARHLVTLSEMEESCIGAIEVELLTPRAAPAIPRDASSVLGAEAEGLGSRWLAAPAGAGGLLLLMGGLLLARRRRAPAEAALIDRCRAADKAVRREVGTLGPAFGHVASASGRLLDTALQARSHLEATRRASKRTSGLNAEAAQATRARLRLQEGRGLESLKSIAERLEATAADLAALQAGQSRVLDLDQVVAALDCELETAVEATCEVGL